MAALFALLPGMGAVYNGQNTKAIVHFVSIAGLFQLAAMGAFPGFFLLGGVAFYAFSVTDAYRTARLIDSGLDPVNDESRFKKQLLRRSVPIGAGLMVTGLLLFIRAYKPLNIDISLTQIVAVGLVILGGYVLTRYFKRRDEGYPADYPDRRPFALIDGQFPFDRNRKAKRSQRPGEYR